MAKRKTESEEKPTKKPHKTKPEIQYSLCIPSTVISSSNARNLQQITNIAYQIVKVATLFNIPEIVVLDIPTIARRNEVLEKEATKTVKIDKKIKFNEVLDDEVAAPAEVAEVTESDENANNAELLESLLQYFITPPYLVKSMFKDSKYLAKFKYAEKLPKISTLPFMNNNQVYKDFKEGISIAKKSPGSKKQKNKLKVTKYINIGESTPIELEHEVQVNVRVTVDLKNKRVVSPLQAYGVAGTKSSFCFYTRIASKFNEVFTKSSFPNGYTSSVFINCDDYFNNTVVDTATSNIDLIKSESNNQILLVFGNSKDLHYSFSHDSSINLPNVLDIFDHQFHIPTNIRIEDAALVSLAKLAL